MPGYFQTLLVMSANLSISFSASIPGVDMNKSTDSLLIDTPPLSSPTDRANALSWVLAIVIVFLAYKLAIKPMYNRLMYFNDESDRLRKNNHELQEILNEFVGQNSDINRELDGSGDPCYLPDNETPNKFVCPITREVIRAPVLINEGTAKIAYERSALQRWYNRGNRTTPLSRSALPDPQSLNNNIALRKEISQYIVSRRALLSDSNFLRAHIVFRS